MLLKLSKSSAVIGYIVLFALSLIHFFINWFTVGNILIITAILILLGAVVLSVVIHRQNLSRGYIVSGLLFIVLCYSDKFFLRGIELIIETLIAIIASSMLLRSHNKSSGYVSLFNGTFLLSIISIINYQFIIALPFIWIMLIVYGDNNYKDWLISLIAAALPYILLLSFCFIFERWDYLPLFDLTITFPQLSTSLILPAVFVATGVLAFVQQMKLLRGDIVYVRNMSFFLAAFIYFTLFFILFYTSDASHIFFPVIYSFIIGKYLNAMRKKWFTEVMFLLLVIGAVILG